MKILKKRSHKKEIIFSKNDFNVIFIRLHFKRKKKKGLRSEILLSKRIMVGHQKELYKPKNPHSKYMNQSKLLN